LNWRQIFNGSKPPPQNPQIIRQSLAISVIDKISTQSRQTLGELNENASNDAILLTNTRTK
jgi:hypothetical protein